MTTTGRGSSVIEFPNELDILLIHEFDAPIELVFDVLTNPEHVRKTMAPFGEEVKVCSIDLRVGGDYHYVFVPDGGPECSFRGTFLEVDVPRRTAETWTFEGWPGVEAVETVDLEETNGVTRLRHLLAFRDQAGRDRMWRTDGLEANYEHVDNLVRSLVEQQGRTSR
jgi:uncharacterized protein YndB with AHSA1/START domain